MYNSVDRYVVINLSYILLLCFTYVEKTNDYDDNK